MVADFPPFSAAPRFSELLSARSDGHAVYQVDPLAALSQDRPYVSLPELAAGYAEAFASARPPAGRVFVVGHCSAAALSLRITKLLAASRQVTAILLQPTWPDDRHVMNVFAEFQANVGSAIQPCPGLDGDPGIVVARMEQLLRDEMAAMAARQGLDSLNAVFADLLLRYRAWLAFVLACRNAPPVAPSPGAVAVKLLTGLSTAVAVPGFGPDCYQVHRVPILNQEVKATAEVTELLLAQITAR